MTDRDRAPGRPKPPPAPRDYTAEARKLWGQVVSGWDLDAPALALLDSACRALERVRQAQRMLKKDGLIVADRFGQQKPHPAATIERDAKMTLLRNVKALNLDLEPLHDRPGRPPGGRAA